MLLSAVGKAGTHSVGAWCEASGQGRAHQHAGDKAVTRVTIVAGAGQQWSRSGGGQAVSCMIVKVRLLNLKEEDLAL